MGPWKLLRISENFALNNFFALARFDCIIPQRNSIKIVVVSVERKKSEPERKLHIPKRTTPTP